VDKDRGEKDWAFIPHEMPPNWQFDPSLWPVLVDARAALGKLDGIGLALPNPQLLLRPLQNREAVASSAIEGTHVTSEQLALYELDPKEPSSKTEAAADWQEVHNYGRALQHGYSRLVELPICTRLIKEMHQILMDGVRGHDKQPGEFRSVQVSVGKGYRFIPPPPKEVQRLMENFESYANPKDGAIDPLVGCFIAHYQFEAIHPFRDGNGRVGRALLSLMIYLWLKQSMPWLYMSPYFDRHNDEYEAALFAVSATGDWNRWIGFCLLGATAQANDSIRRCDALKRLQNEFYEKIKSECDGPRIHPIVNGLFTSPMRTVPSVVKEYNISYQTARADLERLVECGILKEVPDAHPRLFYAPQILAIAYRNLDVVQNDEYGNAAT
jgi:Fic family protein